MDRVNVWTDVSDAVVNKFEAYVRELQRKMVPMDCDGDYTVEITIIDRRHYERPQYFLVPYRDSDRDGHIPRKECLVTNTKMAIEALDKELMRSKFFRDDK